MGQEVLGEWLKKMEIDADNYRQRFLKDNERNSMDTKMTNSHKPKWTWQLITVIIILMHTQTGNLKHTVEVIT